MVNDMTLAEKIKQSASIPPIDMKIPETVATATFALG